MKLARPDVFHPRIVFAGSPDDGDDAGLVAALRQRGLHAVWRCWNDPQTLRADLVILRDIPDDGGSRDEFFDWTTRVANLRNGADVVAWNAAQRYLRDLGGAGVPVVAAAEQARAEPTATALVFLGGAASHAFTTTGKAEPPAERWEIGRAAVGAAAARLGIDAAELLYARADVTGYGDGVRLAALDLMAPSLGWTHLDAGTRVSQQRQFARCVESALERLGLGPLSHRRP